LRGTDIHNVRACREPQDPAGEAEPVRAPAEHPSSLADLDAHLRRRLPDFMLPSRVIVLDELPLTSNGKLDRCRLTELRGAATPRSAGGAPRTAVEDLLCVVWAKVLGLAEIGIHDDFFQLGGHSLLATRLIARVREALGVELPLRTLFDAPTVARFAERLEAARRTHP